MNEKPIYVLFLFSYLIVVLMTIRQLGYMDNSQLTIIIPTVMLMLLFCAIILFSSSDKKNSKNFALIMLLVSVVTMIGCFPMLFLSPVVRTVAVYFPYMTYKFFKTFNFMPNSSSSKKHDLFLFIQSTAVAIGSFFYSKAFGWMISMLLITILVSFLFLYFKEKSGLTTKTKKELKTLSKVIACSLGALVISASILSGLLLLMVPVAVGIILMKRNQIRINKATFMINLMTHFICSSLLFIVCFYVLHLSVIDSYLILMVYCLILFTLYLKNCWISKLEIKRMQQKKKEFQKEKNGITQTFSKEKLLSEIGTLISDIMVQYYKVNSHLIIWKDQNQPYILSRSGVFSHSILTNKILSEVEQETETIYYKGNAFKKIPFLKQNKNLGWFLVNEMESRHVDTSDYKSLSNLVKVIGNIINENENLYDAKQEALKIEHSFYDDYVNYDYLNRVQNFHKEFSFFIHDMVLQDILALKKLTESLHTEDVEAKRIMLNTFDELNKTFRDRLVELYPTTIEKNPLSKSVELLCAKFNDEQKDIKIKFYCYEEPFIEKEEKFHVYRIIQELVTNALKHSQATEILVVLNQCDDYLESIVQDNGMGFNDREIKLNTVEAHHFGLLSIKQEIDSLNGKLTISSLNPKGTQFSIQIPTDKEDRNQ